MEIYRLHLEKAASQNTALYDTCWSLCIDKVVGTGLAVQDWDESMCQRNCIKKFQSFTEYYSLSGTAAEYYEKKIEELSRTKASLKNRINPPNWKEKVIEDLNLKATY